LSLLILLGCNSKTASSSPPKPTIDAFQLMAAIDHFSATDLWPGFVLKEIPVAIYDGKRTLLFQHPSPPKGFAALPDHSGVWAYPGRFPDITANTSAIIGGVQTATVLPSPGTRAAAGQRVALLAHEMFHVFQRKHHPAWSSNEADLFIYPTDDVQVYFRRQLEDEALRRALHETDSAPISCWARKALQLRRERFAALPASSVAYERGNELNEGLATYIQHRVQGPADTVLMPTQSFSPEAIRDRGYASGDAMARLLDKLSPKWQENFDRADSTSLDEALAKVLESSPTRGETPCKFPQDLLEATRQEAERRVGELQSQRSAARKAFVDAPGWKLVLIANGSPLFPQGFDPLNVQIVGPGEVLHRRYLKLGNDAGSIEVLGHSALTVAAGQHPLFNGVRSLSITGLLNEPSPSDSLGAVILREEGLSVSFKNAVVERGLETVTIRIGK